MTKQKHRHLRLLTSTANSRTIRREVRFEMTSFAAKQMEKLPHFILESTREWINAVKEHGLHQIRKISGYHDEPLKGHRIGQRSIRLNRSWRLIYESFESENKTLITVTVVEVNKHEY